jgi:hypothetical protein
VANARLKAAGFSDLCRWLVRVAGKGVRGAVASDEWLAARSEAENLWKEHGGLICERNMGDDSKELNYCQGTVPGYLSFE